jgi:uncharacterized protein YcbK (DUF882 family)
VGPSDRLLPPRPSLRHPTKVLGFVAGALSISIAVAAIGSRTHRADGRPSRTISTVLPTAPSGVASNTRREESHPLPRAAPQVEPSPYAGLAPLAFSNLNTQTVLMVRLYADDGRIDQAAAAGLDAFLADTRDPKHPEQTVLDRRLLQLVFRAAYHFGATEVRVTSAYRAAGRHREGLHALGRAIDFSLGTVKAAALASYLRGLPRVGVGVYTHPRTQFVHLDVRDESYHWLDASPPGRTWRGLRLPSEAQKARDAAYVRASDWPEAMTPPPLP